MAGTFAGGVLRIGTTALIDFTSPETALADFLDDDYVIIGELNNMGELGSVANIVQFPLVSDDFVQKAKGGRNAGDPAIIVGRKSDDPGQIRVRAGEATNFYHNFWLSINDAANENYSKTAVYFRAIIAGIPMQFGGQEDFVTETYTLGAYPRPLIVESALISPAP